MKRFRVDLHDGYQLIDRQFFDAEEEARRHYRQTEPPALLFLELWQWTPPRNVVMGHRIPGW